MLSIVWVLCFLIANGSLADQVSRRTRSLVNADLPWRRLMPHHASKVPFWIHQDKLPDCTTPGYFINPNDCKQFIHCTLLLPGQLIRTVYTCNGDRLYSSKLRECVKLEENDRPECSDQIAKMTSTTESHVQLAASSDNIKSGADGSETKIQKPEIQPSNADSITSNPLLGGVDVDKPKGLIFAHYEPVDRQRSTSIVPVNDIGNETLGNLTTTLAGTMESTTSFPMPSYESTKLFQQSCTSEGYFPDQTNCRLFYRCVQLGFTFAKHVFSCPYGTIWDNKHQTCNFPANVEITNSCKYALYFIPSIASVQLPTSEVPNEVHDANKLTGDRLSIVCPTGFRRHPKYCNTFYQCTVNDRLDINFMAFACPEGTIYDEDEIQCKLNNTDLTVTTAATATTIESTNSTTPSSEKNGCATYELKEKDNKVRVIRLHNLGKLCEKEGKFPYGEICSNSYFQCIRNDEGNLAGYLLDCPIGQLYSLASNGCVPITMFPFCARRYQTNKFYSRVPIQ